MHSAIEKILLLLMDKRCAERCPFSRPFNKGRKAVNKGKRLYYL
jgi:hypothetical protein